MLVAAGPGEVFAFAHGKEKKPLTKLEADHWFLAGPVFANGTLYLTADIVLYAVRNAGGGP